jgi:putative endonuclease
LESLITSTGSQAGIPSVQSVFVYALANNLNSEIYVGISKQVDIRLHEHNSGKNRYTKAFVPWHLFFSEPHNSYMEARKREKYFKSAAGKKILKSFLAQIIKT